MTNYTHIFPSDVMNTCDGLFYCLAQWMYQVTNGLAFSMMLLAFCIVLMVASSRFGTPRSFGFASVTGMLGAILLAIMQLMPWWTASAFILVGVAGFAVMIMNEK